MASFLTAYRGNCFREACTRVNRYNGLNRWNNIYVSGAVRVVVFMSNGSARALSDNGVGCSVNYLPVYQTEPVQYDISCTGGLLISIFQS